MKFKNKSFLKVAALSLVAAFSFGLSISCFANRNGAIQSKAAFENGMFEESNHELSFSYYEPGETIVTRTTQEAVNGFVTERGTFAIEMSVWGTTSGDAPEAELERGTIEFINGYYLESDPAATGIYGTIVAYPNNVPGLVSSDEYLIDVQVQPSNMNPTYTPGWNYNGTTFILVSENGTEDSALDHVALHLQQNETIDLYYTYSGGMECFTATGAWYYEEDHLVTGTFENFGFLEIDIGDALVIPEETEDPIDYRLDSWNYDPNTKKLMWYAEGCDPEETTPSAFRINSDGSITVHYVNSGNHNYDPSDPVIFTGGDYDQDANTVTGTPDVSYYNLSTHALSSESIEVTMYDLVPEHGVQGITLNKESERIAPGSSFQLTATVFPENAVGTFEWLSDDTDVANVTQDGLVTGISQGSTSIRYVDTDTQLNGVCQVTVAGLAETFRVINGSEIVEELELYENTNLQLEILPYPEENVCEVTWSTSNPSVFLVDENGLISAVSAGTAELQVTDVHEVADSITIPVTVLQSSSPDVLLAIHGPDGLIGDEYSITYAEELQLGAVVDPEDADVKLVWASENESIAKFDESIEGLLCPTGVTGTTVITLTDTNSSASISFTLEVVEPETIQFLELRYNGSTLSSLQQEINTVFSLTPYYEPLNVPVNFEWESSSPSCATVDSDGVITCRASGTTIITCTETRSGLSFTCTLTVVLPSGLYYDAANNAFKFNDTTAYRLEMYRNTYFRSSSGEEDTAYIQYSLINEDTGEETSIQNVYLRETQLIETSDAYYISGSWVEANGYTRSTPQYVELIYEEKPTVYLEGFNFDEETHKFKQAYGSKEEEILSITENRAVYEDGTVSVYFSGTDAVLVMTECEIVRNPDELNRFEITGYYSNSDEPVTFFLRATIQEIEGWSDEPVTLYEITFDPNGGVGEMSPIQVEKGYNDVPPCDFTREGYSFAGWAVGSPDGTVINPDESVYVDNNYTLYALWTEDVKPVPAADPIKEETIEEINYAMDSINLSGDQIDQINNKIIENQEYISDDTGNVIYEALLGTTINYEEPEIAEAQKELVVTVVETAVEVDAGKATDIQQAQTIDKALPDNANFSVESEIDEFYARQMYELFGGQSPTKLKTRAGVPTYSIDTDTKGKSGQEAVDYLADEKALYGNMVDFVDTGVDHMGKAALKLRKCSGESVTVQVKSYVTVVKVSSYREFDKEAADKEFVEAIYKAILLSMQNEVISILEKEHKPSGNAEKEAQYNKELEAVKDIETFEIMVAEVLRQKYNSIVEIDKQIADVEEFMPVYWEIFTAWALDTPSEHGITLEELTTATIEQSTGRAKAFTVNSHLTAGEWGFIAGIAGGMALIITASAVIPTLLKKKREKEGIR